MTYCGLPEGHFDLSSYIMCIKLNGFTFGHKFVDPLNIDKEGFQMTLVTLRNGPRSNGWFVTKGHEKI